MVTWTCVRANTRQRADTRLHRSFLTSVTGAKIHFPLLIFPISLLIGVLLFLNDKRKTTSLLRPVSLIYYWTWFDRYVTSLFTLLHAYVCVCVRLNVYKLASSLWMGSNDVSTVFISNVIRLISSFTKWNVVRVKFTIFV